ncbi:MAG: tRNA pseudouridine(55) synthase TruB, partial [Acetanaerobacterium sp.]
ATGVLPVFVGAATKACDLLPDTGKTYIAGLRLGVTTDTQDIWGRVITQKECNDHPVTAEQFAQIAGRFLGDIMQMPPMYSAVKIGGKRLYEFARRGVEIERPERPVTIHELCVQKANEQAGEYTIEVSCSKGTYIRTLCADIGDSLGCGAVMTSLVRTRASGFLLEDCMTLDEIERRAREDGAQGMLIPVERAFMRLPELRLNEEQTMWFLNGAKFPMQAPLDHDLRVYAHEGTFLGLGYIERQTARLRVRRFMGGQTLRG